MAKIVIECSDGNVAEACFNPDHPDGAYYEYGFYCWEMWWTMPEQSFIGLGNIKGLFSFIRSNIAPITV